MIPINLDMKIHVGINKSGLELTSPMFPINPTGGTQIYHEMYMKILNIVLYGITRPIVNQLNI